MGLVINGCPVGGGGENSAVRFFAHIRIFRRNFRMFPPFFAKTDRTFFCWALDDYVVRISPHDSALSRFPAQSHIFWQFTA